MIRVDSPDGQPINSVAICQTETKCQITSHIKVEPFQYQVLRVTKAPESIKIAH